MKPRLFIGSSKESIAIAHAAQMNLQHSAEVTVWDQNVFCLSITSLESLLEQLKTSDFAMFIFSPDDVVRIRQKESAAVRDNVIFELGLFIGFLGRERCFVLAPEEQKDLRIPTDLLGSTIATYQSDRSDCNFQAATGPSCSSVRQRIDNLGMRPGRMEIAVPGSAKVTDETTEKKGENTKAVLESKTAAAEEPTPPVDAPDEKAWIVAWENKHYEEAKKLAEQELSSTTDKETVVELRSFIGFVTTEFDFKNGVQQLKELIAADPKHRPSHARLSLAYAKRKQFVEALEALDNAAKELDEPIYFVDFRVYLLQALGQDAEIEQTLLNAIVLRPSHPDFYVDLANHYAEHGNSEKAIALLEDGDDMVPNNESILFRYAELLSELGKKKLALIPYRQLVSLRPENSVYAGYRGNIYVDLDLKDLALRDYRHAAKLTEEKEAWILGNIGNVLNNAGLPSDAIIYFKRALEIDPESQYAHERIATAYKTQKDEETKANEIVKDARLEITTAKNLRRSQPKLPTVSTAPANIS